MSGNEQFVLYKELNDELQGLKEAGEAPEWLTIEGWGTLKSGYLLTSEEPKQFWQEVTETKDDGTIKTFWRETPKEMWARVAEAAASYYKILDENGSKYRYYCERFFELFWKGWLGGASPVLSNMGTDKGYPISCFASYVGDNRESIFSSFQEIPWLTSNGGGTAVHISDIRARGAAIANGGVSSGVVPWLKIHDSEIVGVSQSGFRKGALAAYLNIDHPDFDDFIKMRQPHGDPNFQCLNIHHAVVIPDSFMERLQAGDEEARRRWAKVLQLRRQTGEPYLFFIDTVNRANPECYKALGLDVKGSNLCCEINLHTSELYTLVCCLSSLNAAKYDEWKNDSRVVQDSIYLLDAVMEEFIQKARGKVGFEKAVAFAEKSRALGLGVMGYHTLLQQRSIPFASNEARVLNEELFERLEEGTLAATAELAFIFGEPEWCKGFGVRNTHTTCCAPTKSNSTICGNVSEGIEPIVANYFIKDTKGAFIQRNTVFAELLKEKGYDQTEVWSDILAHAGSVQHLPFLSEHEKAVFLTAHEIDQLELVRQAAARQQYIDQSQSLNLFFPESATLAEINKVHFAAWKLGVKSLYYQKGEPKSRAGSVVDYEAIKPATAEACPLIKSDDEVCIPCQG
jgi:ribonucleoside-diphosphate reductase alpha chain